MVFGCMVFIVFIACKGKTRSELKRKLQQGHRQRAFKILHLFLYEGFVSNAPSLDPCITVEGPPDALRVRFPFDCHGKCLTHPTLQAFYDLSLMRLRALARAMCLVLPKESCMSRLLVTVASCTNCVALLAPICSSCPPRPDRVGRARLRRRVRFACCLLHLCRLVGVLVLPGYSRP
eukprot:2483908-Pleurochrysis_carterae.AAC.5